MTSENATVNAPIVVDLGKHRRKQVKKLRNGKPGKLMDDVKECIKELKTNEAISESVQPLIVVVREKRKRGRRWYD
jgi:hypothetical protein